MDINSVTLPQIASVQELQRNYRKLLNWVKKTRNPLYLFKNNKPEAVIVDVENFDSMRIKVLQLEEKEALEAIAIGKSEFKQGKAKVLTSLADLIKENEN